MKHESANSCSTNDSRCHHRFPNGTRCRTLAPSSDARFCTHHARLPQNQAEPAEMAADLTTGIGELASPADVSKFLSRLLTLFAEDRISPRRAAVLAYISSQLLRSFSAAERESQARSQAIRKLPPKIICDIPRPYREYSDQTPNEESAQA